MSYQSEGWEPTREAAREALEDFLPRAGDYYQRQRNYDRGPGDRANVSQLSPWVRVRLISESEIIQRTLQQHSKTAAEKFIQEVCWRTYWKGWLEMRPLIWRHYREEIARDSQRWEGDEACGRALAGLTGIDCFDAWARELVETGYLHNHARMWFASIWIFTLGLPWALGADFFIRHLLDGDPASNTLGWRWVAGLQTPGKNYIARKSNIRKYTEGRFRLDAGLNEDAAAPEPTGEAPPPKEPEPLPWQPPRGRAGLFLHEDDLSLDQWLEGARFAAAAGALPRAVYAEAGLSEKVTAFRSQALDKALERHAGVFQAGEPERLSGDEPAREIAGWARERQLDTVVMAKPFTGWWSGLGADIEAALRESGCRLQLIRRPWDEALFPHAKRGFFAFRKQMGEPVRRAAAGDLR